MDGNIFIDLKAESYSPANYFEYRHFKHAREAIGTSDDHGFLGFPRQDQHSRTSVFMIDPTVASTSRSASTLPPDKNIHPPGFVLFLTFDMSPLSRSDDPANSCSGETRLEPFRFWS
jgi:hypothetical protein